MRLDAKAVLLGVCAALAAFTVANAQTAEERERLRQLQSLPYVSPPGQSTPDGRTGVIGIRSESAAPGLNFYFTRFTNRAFVMTNDGKVLHEWSAKDRSAWLDAEVLPDGSLIAISGWDAFRAAEFPDEKGFPAYITKLSRDSRIVWRHRLDAHHEIQLLNDQNILTLVNRTRSLPAVSKQRQTVDNVLTILSPAGAVVATRSIYDLLKPVQKQLPLLASEALIGGALDIFHANSVHWIDDALSRQIRAARPKRTHPLHAAGTVLLCIRHQDAVVAFDWKTSKVLWTWGRGELQGPHAASLLPNGNVLVFDNGLKRGASRIVEVDPVTNQIVWQYAAREPKDFYSGTGGYVQRLPNGNTLITNSWAFQAVEVTPDKRMVWNWINPEKSFTYRLKRRDWSYFKPEFAAHLRRQAATAAGKPAAR